MARAVGSQFGKAKVAPHAPPTPAQHQRCASWTIPVKPHTIRTRIMEIERINLIGTQLTDLSARTGELRGYL